MRIIGGKDYYDSARAFGADEQTVFVREKFSAEAVDDPILSSAYTTRLPSFVYNSRHKYGYSRSWGNSGGPYLCVPSGKGFGSYYYLQPVTIVVAGVFYLGFAVSEVYPGIKPKQMIWTYEALVEWLAEYQVSIRKADKWNDTGKFTMKSQKAAGKLLDHLIDNKISVAIRPPHAQGKWLINTEGLSVYEFARVVDPYQCFQQISMWVGGVLSSPSNPPVELTGESIMLQKHGMDSMSFKKYPTKR